MPVQIERSWADILSDIVSRIQEIIRSEFRLARTEITEEASKAGRAATALAAGAVFGLYAGAFLLLAAMYGLEKLLPAWLSALILAVVVGCAAMALLMAGLRRLKRVKLPPPKTISTVRENMQWAKHQAT